MYRNNEMDNIIATSMECTKFMDYFKITLAKLFNLLIRAQGVLVLVGVNFSYLGRRAGDNIKQHRGRLRGTGCNLGIGATAHNSQNRWPTCTDNKVLTALYFQNPLAHVSQSLDFLFIQSKCFICSCPETDTKYQISPSKHYLGFSSNQFPWLSGDQGFVCFFLSKMCGFQGCSNLLNYRTCNLGSRSFVQ